METTQPNAEIVVKGLRTITEVARFLRLSKSGVYALMRDGKLSYVKMGRSRRIPAAAVRQFAASHLVTG